MSTIGLTDEETNAYLGLNRPRNTVHCADMLDIKLNGECSSLNIRVKKHLDFSRT